MMYYRYCHVDVVCIFWDKKGLCYSPVTHSLKVLFGLELQLLIIVLYLSKSIIIFIVIIITLLRIKNCVNIPYDGIRIISL